MSGMSQLKRMEVIEKIMSAVGREVSFVYPNGEPHQKGILMERVVSASDSISDGVPYWNVIDKISFPDEQEDIWIRIGYYRMPGDRLVWGSQTTITETPQEWKKLLVKAAKEKEWFRALLLEVVNAIEEE